MKEVDLTLYMTRYQRRRKEISALFSGASKSSTGKNNTEGTATFERIFEPAKARQLFELMMDRYL
jgi:hypothetical protein